MLGVFLTSLVVSVLLKPCSVSGSLYPTHAQGTVVDWEYLPAEKIKCPHLDPFIPRERDTVMTGIKRPKFISENLVKGSLCHKVAITTTCSETFFGSTSVTYEVEELKVTSAECRFKQGTTVLGVPPNPQCSWASTQSVRKEILVVGDLTVHYDMFTRNYLSPHFSPCNYPPCFSSNQLSVWITDQRADQSCEMHEVSAWLSDPESGVQELHGNEFLPKKLDIVCRLTFCGQPGFKFDDLDWLYISPGTDLHRRLMNNPECTNRSILSYHEDDPSGVLMTEMSDTIAEDRCFSTVSNYLTRGLMTKMGLSTLIRNSPGPGWAYKVKDGRLFRTRANYVWLHQVLADAPKTGLLHSDESTGRNYFWASWDQNNKGVWNGPNGITIINGTVTNPVDVRLVVARHEHLITPLEINEDTSLDDISEHHPSIIDGLVTYHWNMTTIMIFVGSLLGVALFCCRCNCVEKRQKFRESPSQQYPMTLLYSPDQLSQFKIGSK